MNEIWSSVDSLSRLNSYLQLAVVIAGVVTALLCAASWFASERLAELEDVQKIQLQDRVRVAEEDAAHAKNEAEAVATRQKPRLLNLAQKQVILDVLRVHPKGAVTIVAVMSDPEAERFALQLYEVFQRGDWMPKGVNLAMMSPAPSGVFLRVRVANPPLPHAVAVQQALMAANIQAPGALNAKLDPATVEIVVGHKP